MAAGVDSVREQVLGSISDGTPADEILKNICLAFERNFPETKAGVTMLDQSAQVFEGAIFPSLSTDYADALRGIAVADKPGSCAIAIFEGRTVICTDVATDTRFSEIWRNLGVKHGLEALVSIPARGDDHNALGTFVVAYPPKSGLHRDDLRTADTYAALCGLALSYRRKQMDPQPVTSSARHSPEAATSL